MVREDLVSSAVILQDPSVSNSPQDKKIAFLQAKNLTQEEVDLAFSRAGSSVPVPQQTSQYGFQSQPMPRARLSPSYGHGHGPYQAGPWGPSPPPQRDWRDWFIMATVTSGVGYGLYTVAKRYILPLIAPPTPPQLEQDKAAIDESFEKAFALIDQLASDTATLKASEADRQEKLDTTLKDVDTVIADLKATNARRETENRIAADQIQGLKDLVPRALEGWKANGDARLDELSQEMQSLKRLLENRVGRSAGTSTPIGRGYPTPSTNGSEKSRENQSSTSPAEGDTVSDTQTTKVESSQQKRGLQGSERKAAIPAWQLAAAGKSKEDSTADASA
ncbi:uncharacterized protein KY384_000700 [Bacidia gigantensis]|uniref:uncharacterized protein n=1 Tax=Bacidia gigantensis TaxID=2732470 RepID=UPI001D05BF3C|nr:uncharacterized protein KY384_000700 [Bacidia gigantensis]KAG8525938.1 hypothetical protein KY384_000700 [Bacidia gigantensis]